MSGGKLNRDASNIPVQVFPWSSGKVAITAAGSPLVAPRLIYCVAAGDIEITWGDGTTSARSMVQGECFGLTDAASVAITSGTYDWV